MEHLGQMAVIIAIALIYLAVGLVTQALPVSFLLRRSLVQHFPVPIWAKWLIVSTFVNLAWLLVFGLLTLLIFGKGA